MFPGGNIILAESTVDALRILVACALLVGVVGIGVLVVTWFRRYLKSDIGPSGIGFTLGELRQLRDSGKMSIEEYERARTALVGAVGGKQKSPAGPAKYASMPNDPSPPPADR
jgi:hypothetical protein